MGHWTDEILVDAIEDIERHLLNVELTELSPMPGAPPCPECGEREYTALRTIDSEYGDPVRTDRGIEIINTGRIDPLLLGWQISCAGCGATWDLEDFGADVWPENA
jgi:hypothetical protein